MGFSDSCGSEKDFLNSPVSEDSGDLVVREDTCSEELAPIVLTLPFLLPGYEPTREPPASRPSPSGSFGSLDARAPVRWYSGRTADGAGSIEQSCNELPGRCEILPSLAGLMAVTTCYPPVNLLAHSGVNGSLSQPFGTFHYECPGFDSGCRQLSIQAFRFFHYQRLPASDACRRVNSLHSKPLRILDYRDVRGPPKRRHA